MPEGSGELVGAGALLWPTVPAGGSTPLRLPCTGFEVPDMSARTHWMCLLLTHLLVKLWDQTTAELIVD